ncbi:MAG TPA: hypothetical protein VF796_14955 [Humisphaera sp.]
MRRGGSASGGSSARGSSARGSSSKLSRTTTDHDEIRQWAESRGAKPSCVRGTGGKGDAGLLRLDFPGFSGAGKLQAIEWEEFFEKFDEQGLALLYQEKTAAGKPSNFNKLVSRETAAKQGGGGGAARGGASKSRGRGSSAAKGKAAGDRANPTKAKHGRGSR